MERERLSFAHDLPHTPPMHSRAVLSLRTLRRATRCERHSSWSVCRPCEGKDTTAEESKDAKAQAERAAILSLFKADRALLEGK